MALTLNTTTLAAAVAVTAEQIQLASIANVQAGHLLVIDREVMLVPRTPTTTFVDVVRGWSGTVAAQHASGSIVWTNAPDRYYSADPEPNSAAALATEYAHPHLNLQNGNGWLIQSGRWAQFLAKGQGVPLAAGAGSQDYAQDGAIAVEPGMHRLTKAGVNAMTLADPGPLTPEGSILTIVSTTANAHTVTYAAGFWGGGAADDVATFVAAAGNFLVIQNQRGAWRPISLLNVSFG